MAFLIGIDLGTSGTKTVLFDETGRVTGVSPGACTVYAVSKDGQKSDACKVTVE